MNITRREAMKSIAVVSSMAAIPSVSSVMASSPVAATPKKTLGTFPYTLPDLPYATDALEPFIDKQTMEIHHGKHHAGYVKKLNLALQDNREWAASSLEDLLQNMNRLPDPLQTAVRKHGGGHYNHSMFWTSLRPASTHSKPSSDLEGALTRDFGSVDNALDALKKQALSVFGSGWAWFVVSPFGRISVDGSANQENPVMTGRMPLLGIDVWEHAYYLNYQNRRANYLDSVFKILNWSALSDRYRAIRKS